MDHEKEKKSEATIVLLLMTFGFIFFAFHTYLDYEAGPERHAKAFWILVVGIVLLIFTIIRHYLKVIHSDNYYYVLNHSGIYHLMNGNLNQAYKSYVFTGKLFECQDYIQNYIPKFHDNNPEDYLIVNFMIPKAYQYSQRLGDSQIKVPKSDSRYDKIVHWHKNHGCYFHNSPRLIYDLKPTVIKLNGKYQIHTEKNIFPFPLTCDFIDADDDPNVVSDENTTKSV